MTDGMIYERGKESNLFATFVTTAGEAATIVGTPTISMFHMKAGVLVTDINTQDMTQATETTYYYPFFFGNSVDRGPYFAKFTAVYNTGQTVLGEQTFRLVDKHWFRDAGKGGGGVIKSPGSRDKIWSAGEKTTVLNTLAQLGKSIEDLQILPALIKKPSKELTAQMNLLSDEIKAVHMFTKETDKKRTSEIPFILGQIRELQTDLTGIAKRSAGSDKELKQKMVELDKAQTELTQLMLKQIPEEALDNLLVDQQDESEGTSSERSQG